MVLVFLGSESLVIRLIQILAEKEREAREREKERLLKGERDLRDVASRPPFSAELVGLAKELFERRLPDVRLLLPLLAALTKRDLTHLLLPRLVSLNEKLFRETFHRLAGISPKTGFEVIFQQANIL